MRTLGSVILTEHFRFAPELFAKGCFDIANKTLYSATQHAEEELNQVLDHRIASGEGADEEDWDKKQREEIQRGIYKLETLLEQEIDKKFDLFEIWVLRNTFRVSDDLLPYVNLPHHNGLDSTLKGVDLESVNREYEDELRAYEEEVAKSRRLKVVELFLNEKEKRLSKVKEEIGWLSQTERNSLSTKSANLSALLETLSKSLETLLKTPSPSTAYRPARNGEEGRDSLGVWNDSRSSFINWVAGRQASTAGISGVTRKGVDNRGGIEEGESVGTKVDAKVSEEFFVPSLFSSARRGSATE
ncbi:hypothetical protein JCM5353_006310 [Sporobolomyces roseus]